jgi:hypothetical protein
MTIPPELQEVAGYIESKKAPVKVGVRTMLAWFGAQRRGFYIVQDIRRALKSLDLETDLPRFSQPVITEDFKMSANSFGVR